MTNIHGTLYFTADNGTGTSLWRTDGSERDTALISSGARPNDLTNVNGTLFFVATDDDAGRELWKSDGTETGTIVMDINPGIEGSSVEGLTVVGGVLFFTASDGQHGRELWTVHPRVPGDVNRDGEVDLQDFNILKTHFGLMVATRERGDLNADMSVDLLDFNILKANFGSTAALASQQPSDEDRDLVVTDGEASYTEVDLALAGWNTSIDDEAVQSLALQYVHG